MSPAQIYSKAVKRQSDKVEDTTEQQLVLQEIKEWHKHPLTAKLIEFLIGREQYLLERSMEMCCSAQNTDESLGAIRQAAKAYAVKEIITYVNTGEKPV